MENHELIRYEIVTDNLDLIVDAEIELSQEDYSINPEVENIHPMISDITINRVYDVMDKDYTASHSIKAKGYIQSHEEEIIKYLYKN